MTLPVRRLTLFKHGLCHLEREGRLSGETLELEFPREAMDDVLKSFVALDRSGGRVLGLEFETPWEADSPPGNASLADDRTLLELLPRLRGRRVRCGLEGGAPPFEGVVLGLDLEAEEPLRRARLSLYEPASGRVRAVPLSSVAELELLDASARADLERAIQAVRQGEERQRATLRLSRGEHDLSVGYIAPAPAWRVGYRLVAEGAGAGPSTLLLQGWALFDNTLDEDLKNVELTLVAGMPVSFRYRLHEPRTPRRPLVEDEERTVVAPPEFAGVVAAPAPAVAYELHEPAAGGYGGVGPAGAVRMRPAFGLDALEAAGAAAAGGEERGALFAYRVEHPVSVARGRSAAVPVVHARLEGRRELLYSHEKLPGHPVAGLRFGNATGLTLERGPVTVLEAGGYGGEAVLPFSRAGAEVIVPYAVELGVRARREEGVELRLTGLALRGGDLVLEEVERRRTAVEFESSLAEAVTVTLEHPRPDGFALVDTPEPDEAGLGFARWRLACPPRGRAELTVLEERPRRSYRALASLGAAALAAHLEAGGLAAALRAGLGEVVRLYREAEATLERLGALAKRRKALHERQKRAAESLGPLGRDGEEGALRARLVAELGRLEDDLAELALEEERLRERRDDLERQALERLGELGGAES